MNKLILLATLLLLIMLWLPKASGDNCDVSATSVAFGSFNTLTGSTVDSTGTITVTCNKAIPYTIGLSPGGSGTYSPRSMTNGGNQLAYNLYSDAGYSQVWGDGTGGSSRVSDSIDLRFGFKNHTVYGRIPLSTQRSAVAGSYSDSITVTVTY
jgi:spore coat protein U-like protein